MPRRLAISCAIALVLSAASPQAAAQPRGQGASAGAKDAKPMSAQQRFDTAQKLFDQRKHAEALELFRQVYEESSSPNAHLMMAHCFLALGRLAEAHDAMVATMREAGKRAETEPKYAATRDSAATQVAVLEPKIGKVIVALPEHGQADVSLNGAELKPERLGVPVAVEPGKVIIEAVPASGAAPVRREVTVAAGETKTIPLVFEAKKETAPPPIVEESRGGGVRTAGFVVAGLGVAGMAVFGVAGAMVQSRLSTLETECGGTRCTDAKYEGVIDSGKTLALVTNIGLVAGIAGLVGGGAMIALGGPKKSSASASASAGASIGVSPGGASIVWSGRF